MGYLYEMTCPSCGYQKNIRLGSGIRDCKFEHVLSHFDSLDAGSLDFLCYTQKADFLSFQYQLGRCTNCGRLESVPVFYFQDGSHFTQTSCTCGASSDSLFELLSIDDTITCPECGKPLETARTGIWD